MKYLQQFYDLDEEEHREYDQQFATKIQIVASKNAQADEPIEISDDELMMVVEDVDRIPQINASK